MKSIVHKIVTCALHAFWVAALWLAGTVAVVLGGTIIMGNEAEAYSTSLTIWTLICFIIYVLVAVHKLTE